MSTGKSQSDQSYTDRMPYVFGSSTPREFSYMYQVPQKYRVYDAKFRRSRRTKEEMTLSDYLRQIRCSSPSKRRDRSVDSARNYVFGSSTPRKWSHLEKIPVEYRIYDVSLNNFRRQKRSKTTSFTPTDYSNKHNFPLKSHSSLGVSQTANSPVPSTNHLRNNGNYAKVNHRTQSVPPSVSSSRHNGASSVDSQMSNRSSAVTSAASSQGKVSRQINTNLKRHSSRQSSNEKNPSAITTPNEELVLIVTETVTNVEPPSVLNEDQRESIESTEHDGPQNVAFTTSIPSLLDQTDPLSSNLIETELVKTTEQHVSRDSPKIVIDHHDSTEIHENGRDSDKQMDSGADSDRSVETTRSTSNVKKSFDITNEIKNNDDDFNVGKITDDVITTVTNTTVVTTSHTENPVGSKSFSSKVIESEKTLVQPNNYDKEDHEDDHN